MNKVSEALNNFTGKHRTVIERDPISKADAFGVKQPPMSAQQRAGLQAEGALATQRYEAKLAAHEACAKERAECEKAKEDAIWKKVMERRRWAIG